MAIKKPLNILIKKSIITIPAAKNNIIDVLE